MDVKSVQKRHERTCTRSNKKEGGFTLLEVIVAISILTIGLLAVASMQISSIRGNSFSKDVTESSDRLQDIIEELLALDYTDPLLSDTNGNGDAGLDDALATPPDGSYAVPNTKYTVFWNVADNWAGGKVVFGMKTIRVFVVWQDRGVQKQYVYDFMRIPI